MTWETVKLGDVATIDRRSIQPEQIKSGSIYVGLENIKSWGGFSGVKTVEQDDLASSKFIFTDQHVLFGKLRPYLAKIAVPDFEGICSTDILPIFPKNKLDKYYLAYFLLQPKVVQLANSLCAGANLPRISPSALLELKIPLPPLPEQKRIAAILDKADGLKRKREAAIAKFDQLAQSIFVEMFGNPVINEKGWERKKIVDIGKVITGNTPPRDNPENYGNAIEWIKSDNLNTPHYYLTKATEGLSETGKKIARTVPAGAILITCIAGSADCIGNAAMADREVAFNQQINAFIPENGNSHFYYGQFIVGKQLVQNASTASMKGMVSKGRFEQIEMLVPPLSLQEEFANRISKLEKLKADNLAALAKQNNLFTSLQHQAFFGQL